MSRAEAQELLQLLVSEHDLANETTFLQDVFVSNYLQHNHSIHRALKATGVGYDTYAAWKSDPTFIAKLAFAEQEIVAELFEKARDLAMAGETDMVKFLLACLDPERFDTKYRAQVLANRGQLEAIVEGNKHFTSAELRQLLMDDPARQFLDVTPPAVAEIEAPKDDEGAL